MAAWPGSDEPYYRPQVVLPARPKSGRLRHGSEAFLTQSQVMVDGNGNLLTTPVVDQFGRVGRASSVSGGRPAQIVINNDNGASQAQYDERSPSSQGHRRRPSSGVYYYDEARGPLVRRSGSHRRRRTPSPYYEDYSDYEDERERRRRHRHSHSGGGESRERRPARTASDEAMIKELEEMKKKEEDKRLAKKVEEDLLLKQLKEEQERKARDDEDKKLKEKAIEDYKIKLAAEEDKKKKAKEEEEERMALLLMAGKPGMTEAEARRFIRRAEKKKEGGGSGGRSVVIDDDDDRRDGLGRVRPTYIKVHMRHLSPETLDLYRMPWEWDERDPGYIIIKQWVSESDQEILFNDTKQRKERQRLTYPRDRLKADGNQLAILKDKEKDKRKKSPIKRTSWFFT